MFTHCVYCIFSTQYGLVYTKCDHQFYVTCLSLFLHKIYITIQYTLYNLIDLVLVGLVILIISHKVYCQFHSIYHGSNICLINRPYGALSKYFLQIKQCVPEAIFFQNFQNFNIVIQNPLSVWFFVQNIPLFIFSPV